MAVSSSYLDMVMEMLEPLGTITKKRMFGGAGIFYDGVMFVCVAGDSLYFKVDDQTVGAYEEEGMEPFTPFPEKPGSVTLKSYYQLPEYLLDDEEAFRQWAQAAIGAAMRSAKSAPKKPTRKRAKKPAKK